MPWTLNAIEVAEILDIPQEQANEFLDTPRGMESLDDWVSFAITKAVRIEYEKWKEWKNEWENN